MPIERFMVRPVRWAPATFERDRYGNQIRQAPQWDPSVRMAWLARSSGEEVLGERAGGEATEWLLFSNDTAWPIRAADRVELDGITYEVSAPAHVAWTPSGPHHLEIPLRLVEG